MKILFNLTLECFMFSDGADRLESQIMILEVNITKVKFHIL